MTKSKRGRLAKGPGGHNPRHVPTPESRMKVTQLLAAGMPIGDIALFLRISEPSLDKHYPKELRFGRVERRAEIVGLLFDAARKGNVSAIKHAEAMTTVSAAEDAFKAVDEPAPARTKRLGKKEQAALEAETAGADSDWGADLGVVPAETGKMAH